MSAATITPPTVSTKPKRAKRAKTASKGLVNPVIAWPTLSLFAVASGIWVGMAIAGVLGWVPLWVAIPVLTLAAYALFTPMHDSAHKSVARASWVNEVVGRLCAVVVAAPFPAFRWAHLRHHKKTNDHHEDPDAWSGSGRWWTLPFRWVTQDLYYYFFYIQHWGSRSRKERIEVVGTVLFFVSLLTALTVAGYGFEVVVYWLIPSRLAVGLLALFFDFIPHHPHETTAAEDRYKATSNTRGIWLTPFLLYQNYHLLHHLYPGVPFYRYGRVWREREEKLVAKGGRTLGLIERFKHSAHE